MSLRPVAARWFELLTTRDDLATAVETLARTGSVELESHSETDTRLNMPDLRDRMEEYNRLANRYQGFWPDVELDASTIPDRPARNMDKALAQLRAWARDAAPVIQDIETLHSERADLVLLEEMLAAYESDELDFGLIVHAGPVVSARIFVLPPDAVIKTLPPSLLVKRADSRAHLFMLAVGPVEDIGTLATDIPALKGRELAIPAWLHGSHLEAQTQVSARLIKLDQQVGQLHENLTLISTRHKLANALGTIRRMDWFISHVKSLPVSENFAWVTGWTSDLDGERINKALAHENIATIIHFPQAPRDSRAPMVMNNPWWAQPFELFARMLGTPAEDEVDPSRLLAVVAPVLFGYMFGDVGQGFVILLAGVLLRRRWPITKLLIANGFTAILFGFVFGSVFGSEEIIPALWVNPIDDPLPVLMVPLAGGVIILLLGLLLNAAESWWRKEFARWLLVEAAIVVLYLSLLISNFRPVALYGAGLALAWYLGGSVMLSPDSAGKTLLVAFGRLLESLF